MGFIFRAYFAPMARLNSPQGIPTKVPYLFSNMLRKLAKEHAPDYLAVVFDTKEPTFRDKLFDKYKAKRPPMPEDLSVQLPYVRRMCEAMRLPILEFHGFEADDVIGALAKQAREEGLEVSIVTSDKDMMQLVGGNVRVLRPGAGPDKTDLVVDAAKVEELMGVPPEKVADVMALMGDSIDNIPGAKGIGEKGAKELIRRFGSAEAALDHAKEVEGKRYREALENSRDTVLMSKQLAVIDTNAPVKLVLDDLTRRDRTSKPCARSTRNWVLLRCCSRHESDEAVMSFAVRPACWKQFIQAYVDHDAGHASKEYTHDLWWKRCVPATRKDSEYQIGNHGAYGFGKSAEQGIKESFLTVTGGVENRDRYTYSLGYIVQCNSHGNCHSEVGIVQGGKERGQPLREIVNADGKRSEQAHPHELMMVCTVVVATFYQRSVYGWREFRVWSGRVAERH